MSGIRTTVYNEPEGSLLEVGAHLVNIVSVKVTVSKGEKQSLQIEVKHGCNDGTIIDWLPLTEKSFFRIQQLVAATGGRVPEEVPQETWNQLLSAHNYLEREEDVERFAQWLSGRDRPYWINVQSQKQTVGARAGQDVPRVSVFGKERVRMATENEIKSFKPWVPASETEEDNVMDSAAVAPPI